MAERRKPGVIRDAIMTAFTATKQRELSVVEIRDHVSKALGDDVPASSVRSYLNINTPGQFLRTSRGSYRLARR